MKIRAIFKLQYLGNSETLTRIDSIILQVDTTQSGRVGNIVYRTGTASSSPVHPDINTEDDIYELRLADITVSPSCTEITEDLIEDCRGGDECPYIYTKLDADSSDYIKNLSASNQTVTITYGDDSTSTMTVKGLPSTYSDASYQEGIYNSSSVLSTLNTTTYLYEGIYMLKVAADTTTGIPPLAKEDSEFTGKIYLKTSSTYTGLSSTYAPYIRQDIYYSSPDYDEHFKRSVTYTSSSSITYGDWEKVVETQEEIEEDFATDYLPLSGGTVTGSVTFKAGIELSADTPYIDFHYSKSSDDYTSRIIESSSGTLTVTGNLVVSGSFSYSDKRLKTDFAEINDKFLNAIEELEIQQFRIDNRKDIVFGIIAQDLIEAFEKYKINIEDYGIIKTTKYDAESDIEYYIIDYTQYLVLKQKAQDRKIEKLQNQLNKQEEEIAELRDIINELRKA